MIRYAVVGAGWIAQEAFMPAVTGTGNSRMQALVSGSAASARKLADFHGIPEVLGYDGYDALVQSDRIDAVYIALPNSLHADYAIRAARAGKHVLVEKPLATNIPEAEAMIAAARDGGVFLMTAYRLHHEPGTVAALDTIREGRIGDPRFFSSTFSFQSKLGNHRLQSGHWGGPLQDIGVYCLNAARHVFAAEPVEAIAMASRPVDDPRFAEIDAALAVTLRFPGERLAQFYCSFGAADLDSYQVIGSTGHLTMNPGYRFETATHLRIVTADGAEDLPFPQVDQFAGQIAFFSDCILGNVPPEADGEEGLADMRALLAIEEAARSGLPQPIRSPARQRHPAQDMVRTIPPTTHRLLV